MHLKSLKTYCDVVRLGSFSKAAEANGVSQSNVSQLVHHLEDHLGVRLIDTSKRPFVVTPEGQRYHEGCKEVVRRYEEVERQVKSIHAETGSRITVASIYSVGLGEMRSLVGRYREAHPGIDLRIDYMHPDQVDQAVLSGEVDLGITSYAQNANGLKVWPWREEPFALAVSPKHRLASEESIAPEQLHGLTFVMPQEGLRMRREIDRWLVQHRLKTEVEMEFDNLESIKRAVEVNEGIALLPAPTFASEAESSTLVRIELETTDPSQRPFVRPLGIVSKRGDSLAQPALKFIELLQAETLSAQENGEPVYSPR